MKLKLVKGQDMEVGKTYYDDPDHMYPLKLVEKEEKTNTLYFTQQEDYYVDMNGKGVPFDDDLEFYEEDFQ